MPKINDPPDPQELFATPSTSGDIVGDIFLLTTHPYLSIKKNQRQRKKSSFTKCVGAEQ